MKETRLPHGGQILTTKRGIRDFCRNNVESLACDALGFPPLNREAISNQNTYGSRCPAVAGLWCGGVSSGTGVSVFAAAVPNSSF